MPHALSSVLSALAIALPGAVLAAPLMLSPADPQPQAGDLSPGLAVSYAYPSDLRTLADASAAIEKSGRAGPPLAALDYEDNSEGDLTLTARTSQKVAASISGFIRFDAPGIYSINLISNDGIQAQIGGQQVALYDDIHACEPAGAQEVSVPQPGWYTLEATYFQRKGTACLIMEWQPEGGTVSVVPATAFAHQP
ncbi:hypothetical protein [Sulfitobacter sabulilitoris]|uniref:PA14 domain-containing protein n=1 Tax=Sulfitobacter sabulilitoris TaxID=2562655 RepID=A0A5S3PJT6_9RHOB|nr:hypothetical protein [Sulfitobacter sabulilitoris]TMM54643.1 hypothetical protein FDT80_03375 [Sulfitobacter sabulilitoris]